MLSGYSVRQWQEQYQAGAFDSKDAAVQREAGWWRWHCRDDVVANRLKRIAPVVMGIKSPLILDQCSVWFANEYTENKLLYDSARFERLNGSTNDLFFMVDYKDSRQPDKWTLYTKRFGFHAPEFGCSHVQAMTRYIDGMAHELEQGIVPAFLIEKEAAVEYIQRRPAIYPSRSLRREGEHSYSFLDRDDGRRKTIHVARTLNDIPSECQESAIKEINGLFVCCPDDTKGPLHEKGDVPKKYQRKGMER